MVIGLLSNVPTTVFLSTEPEDSAAAAMIVTVACTAALAFLTAESAICRDFPQALPTNGASPFVKDWSVGSSNSRLCVVSQFGRTSGARVSSVMEMLTVGAACRVGPRFVHQVRPLMTATGGGQMNLHRHEGKCIGFVRLRINHLALNLARLTSFPSHNFSALREVNE